jgi:hypothetical protein
MIDTHYEEEAQRVNHEKLKILGAVQLVKSLWISGSHGLPTTMFNVIL